MTVEDKRHDPSRQVERLGLDWQHTGSPFSYGGTGGEGVSKHYASGGPEDEVGSANYSSVHSAPTTYSFGAEHYDPYNRDPRDESAGWQSKKGDFVVKSPHRAMIAGESLLRRMQLGRG